MRKRTTEEFINDAQRIHGTVYCYSKAVYSGAHKRITVICPTHGEFSIIPTNHITIHKLTGTADGCPTCSQIQRSLTKTHDLEIFVARSTKVHNAQYDYSLVEYKSAKTKVSIQCPKHGTFHQTPDNHVNQRQGCPHCVIPKSSRKEREWLDSIGVPDNNRQVRIALHNGLYASVDGLVGNVVYEYWGDFWHGNPLVFDSNKNHPMIDMTFGELYERTMRKRQDIIASGYDLIEIWETEQ